MYGWRKCVIALLQATRKSFHHHIGVHGKVSDFKVWYNNILYGMLKNIFIVQWKAEKRRLRQGKSPISKKYFVCKNSYDDHGKLPVFDDKYNKQKNDIGK